LILWALILIPLACSLLVVAAPAARARSIATVGTLAAVVGGLIALMQFDWADAAAMQFGSSIAWLPELGISASVGVDSVALLLVTLTILLGPICVIGSFTAITEREKAYYAWLLALQAAMTGVFCARDLIAFFICFEFTLIPMYVLIHQYGSTNRRKAATKFFLFTFTGSIIALAGMVYIAWFHWQQAQEWTFDIATLASSASGMSPREQALVLGALLLGFAVKVPLFPVHTWLPLAHTEAPTAGSVILAGVLLKLGTYGIYRFVLPFAPDAVVAYAPAIAVLSIVGIVYAGLICWVQTDVKKLVAYSSVSHLGFCVLGLVALNATGLTGSVLYMLNHGLSTGALFLMVGMVYERYHTRSMRELGGLAKVMPVWASFFVFFTMASVGLPGLNGFVSEFLCLLGAFQSTAWGDAPGATGGSLGPWFAAVAGSGMIVAAMYLLYMVGKVCFGPLVLPAGHDEHGEGAEASGGRHGPLPQDLSRREIGLLVPLAAGCLWLGVYPQPVIDALEAPVNGTVGLFEGRLRMEAAGEPISDAGQEAPRSRVVVGEGRELEPGVDGESATSVARLSASAEGAL
jgi:NADH-quinone oxidoreductase subunit M